MPQLKMYRLPGAPAGHTGLPAGYSISNYRDESDKQAWADCCKNGLVADNAGPAQFDRSILSREGLNPYEDVFFLDYNGEHIGTTTAYIHPDDGTGDMHMVGIKKEFRGLGLSKYLTQITVEHLEGRVPYIHLTTDDWRRPAIKGYLRGGFLPVIYAPWMERRWQSLATRFGIAELPVLNDDTTPCKVLSARKVLRFGAIGRGCADVIDAYSKDNPDASLSAVYSPDGGDGVIRDLDEFLSSDVDCVIAEGGSVFAIEAMKTGLNVLNTSDNGGKEFLCPTLEKEIFLRGQTYGTLDRENSEESIRHFIASCKGK